MLFSVQMKERIVYGMLHQSKNKFAVYVEAVFDYKIVQVGYVYSSVTTIAYEGLL